MIKLLFIFYFLDVGLALKAQFSNTQVFVDSCNTAITSYEDFLVNFRKSTDKFTQAKSTSGECYKLLLSYKANHILNIDNTTFTNLKVSLEGMKSLDLNQFLKVEKETKDKINIMTDRGTAYIAKQHAGILLALHLFKIDLEKLHASPILNLLNEALKFNDTYLLPFDSLKKRFSDKILIHDSDITYLTSRYRTYYDDTLTVRIQSLQEYSIFTQSPYRIDFFFLEKKMERCVLYFNITFIQGENIKSQLSSLIYPGIDWQMAVWWNDKFMYLNLIRSSAAMHFNEEIRQGLDTTEIPQVNTQQVRYCMDFEVNEFTND